MIPNLRIHKKTFLETPRPLILMGVRISTYLWSVSFWVLSLAFVPTQAQDEIEAPTVDAPSVEVSDEPAADFEDPFAEVPEDPQPAVAPDTPVEEPQPISQPGSTPTPTPEPQIPVIDQTPSSTPTPTPTPTPRTPAGAPDPFGEEPFRRPLEPDSPPPPEVQPREIEKPAIKEIETDREFIERNRPRTRGPKSAKFDRAEKFTNIAPVGTWNMGFDVGPAFNINRRKSQVAFQFEGGYRIWKTLDLNGLLYFRFRGDRIMGFQFMPTWTFAKLFGSIERFDLRAGMGMGWTLRGIRGSDFQIGYFSMRGTVGLYYYVFRNLSLNFSIDLDSFLYRVDTGGDNSTNELSGDGGPPLQWVPHFGVKFEFL